MEALRRLGAVPHQRDINVAPRSESYLDALSEADPRDMSANEQFVQRNAPVIPEYAGHDESDPYEMEPDNDFDDYATQTPAQRHGYDFGQTDIRLRDGRMMEPGEALGFNGSPAPMVGQANYMMRGYTPDTQRVNMPEEIQNAAARTALNRLRGGR
jgi:hypothetical protein